MVSRPYPLFGIWTTDYGKGFRFHPVHMWDPVDLEMILEVKEESEEESKQVRANVSGVFLFGVSFFLHVNCLTCSGCVSSSSCMLVPAALAICPHRYLHNLSLHLAHPLGFFPLETARALARSGEVN